MEELLDTYTRDGEFKKLLYSDKWVPMDKEYKDLVVEKFEEVLKGREI